MEPDQDDERSVAKREAAKNLPFSLNAGPLDTTGIVRFCRRAADRIKALVKRGRNRRVKDGQQ